MKIFNLFLAALFVFSAVLQYNDPDPLLWMSIYLAAGLICAFAAFNKYNRWTILLVLAACAYELYDILPAFIQWIGDGMPSITESMKSSKPHLEHVREFMGTANVFVAKILQYLPARAVFFRKQQSINFLIPYQHLYDHSR
jgi:hypothetical protein